MHQHPPFLSCKQAYPTNYTNQTFAGCAFSIYLLYPDGQNYILGGFLALLLPYSEVGWAYIKWKDSQNLSQTILAHSGRSLPYAPYIDPCSWPIYPRGFDAMASNHMHNIDSWLMYGACLPPIWWKSITKYILKKGGMKIYQLHTPSNSLMCGESLSSSREDHERKGSLSRF